MSFDRGNITFRLYRATETPETLQPTTLALRRYGFRPINPDRGESRATGWVNPRNLVADTLTMEEVTLDHGMVFLAIRTDTKTLNADIFRAALEVRIAQVKEAKRIEKITRQHRLAIEEELKATMLRDVSPSTSFVQLVWDTANARVLIGAAGDQACERAQDVLESTFGVRLSMALVPGIMAGHRYTPQLSPAEAVEKFPTIGAEFLTWLRMADSVGTELGRCAVEMLSPVTLSGDGGEAKKVALAGDDSPADSREAAAALKGGKKIIKARLQINDSSTSAEYLLTLDADRFDIRGAKLPVEKTPDPAANIAARIGSAFDLCATVEALFIAYMGQRDELREAREARQDDAREDAAMAAVGEVEE